MSDPHHRRSHMMNRAAAFLLVVVLVAGVPGASLLEAADTRAATAGVETIDWKDLVPRGYDPDKLLEKYNRDVAKMKDTDPRAERLAEELRKAWDNAPVVRSLDNKTVKLAGFLVTLEGDGKAVSEFLLVPYFGACIHVPPPPSNQIVLVRMGPNPFKVTQMFQTVAVTGKLRTERSSSDLAVASYVIEATLVE